MTELYVQAYFQVSDITNIKYFQYLRGTLPLIQNDVSICRQFTILTIYPVLGL
jgi:hypothetical protein